VVVRVGIEMEAWEEDLKGKTIGLTGNGEFSQKKLFL
jgi:hypothetical protein